MQLSTLLSNIPLHASLNDAYGATHLPVYQTATFDQKRQDPHAAKVYDYSRSDNPTRNALERIFAKAENGLACVCTNTGIAAIHLLFSCILKPGDTVLVETDCYGGTNRLLHILDHLQIKTIYADFTDVPEIASIVSNNHIQLVVCESPTNPSLKIIDIGTIASLCKKHHILFAVDNSMATFAAQKPLELGADFSVFSSTKYISGHGAVTAGALVTNHPDWADKIHYYANAQGLAQSPQDIFVLSLGLPSLVYRMKAQEASALKIAEALSQLDIVEKVNFPGLASHPQYTLAKQQLQIIPGILTVTLPSFEIAKLFIKKTKLFTEKVSFGSADSRLEIPALMSHASLTPAELEAKGLDLKTVRIAVGLEDTNDLIQDITNTLASISICQSTTQTTI